MQLRSTVLIFVGLLLSGCGSGSKPPASSAEAERRPEDTGGGQKGGPILAPEKPNAPRPPPGTLYREDVVGVVRAGLGLFLQRVEVEPSFGADGRFQGFRIVKLVPESFWQGVDLKPGDVVLRVNGRPIERETQAYDAFQTLLTSDELRVSYLRGGSARELVYKITPRPK